MHIQTKVGLRNCRSSSTEPATLSWFSVQKLHDSGQLGAQGMRRRSGEQRLRSEQRISGNAMPQKLRSWRNGNALVA